MMKLSDRAALLRQAAATMDELKKLCQAEGGHGHTVTCCERMAGACRKAADEAEELDEMMAAMLEVEKRAQAEKRAEAEALAAEDDADGEAGTT
jgi:hypothetical protein